ncbi:MAG TPA: winged helix DNA-binding domain-containing protein [Candidatus Limnocylindria bacterium]
MAEPPILGTRALNRALLARQLLLEPSSGPMDGVVEQVGGLQTQVSRSGYIGLWTRLRGLARQDYTAALEGRRLIQGTLMRVTIHTVTAADYWPMAVAVRRPRRVWWLRTWGRGATEADMERAARDVRAELADGPLPLRELRARMKARGHDPGIVAPAGMWVDLVRVPPPGTWDRPRADRYALAADWLPPREIGEEAARELLARRYLGAFGPATLADMSSWSGIAVAELKPIVARLELRRFRDERGRELLDLPDGPLPDPTTPAPARFLPSFDATLLVQARRTQILPDEFRPTIFNVRTPQSWNTFLLDGQVAGTWTHADGAVELDPLRPLTSGERSELEDEADRLEAFLRGPSA